MKVSYESSTYIVYTNIHARGGLGCAVKGQMMPAIATDPQSNPREYTWPELVAMYGSKANDLAGGAHWQAWQLANN